jgi:superfamily I DNA and/or RNA helicase
MPELLSNYADDFKIVREYLPTDHTEIISYTSNANVRFLPELTNLNLYPLSPVLLIRNKMKITS